MSCDITLSGRQDSNLRPPGPQPERWGVAQAMRPEFIGFSASECLPDPLSLIPVLIREHVFDSALNHADRSVFGCPITMTSTPSARATRVAGPAGGSFDGTLNRGRQRKLDSRRT